MKSITVGGETFPTIKACVARARAETAPFVNGPFDIPFNAPFTQQLIHEHHYGVRQHKMVPLRSMYMSDPRGLWTQSFACEFALHGWLGVSWDKAARRWHPAKPGAIESHIKAFFRDRINLMQRQHRAIHPICQQEGCEQASEHTHHVEPFIEVVNKAIGLLAASERQHLIDTFDWLASAKQVGLYCDLPQRILDYFDDEHAATTRIALCHEHHREQHENKMLSE